MPDLVDPEKLASLHDLAKEYGYNGEHLRQVAVAGKLKAWLIGGVWITTKENVELYMRGRQTEGWPQRPLPRPKRKA